MAQDGIFKSFSASVQEDRIVLRWAVVMGAECTDMEVLRSENGVDFEQIHLYPGICGSNSEDKFYEFTDSLPVPLLPNYYQLKSGPGDRSNIILVNQRILPEGKDYALFPHPVTGTSRFVFDNPTRKPHRFLLRDLKGGEVLQLDDLRDGEFELDLSRMESGLYFFLLESEGRNRWWDGYWFTDMVIPFLKISSHNNYPFPSPLWLSQCAPFGWHHSPSPGT